MLGRSLEGLLAMRPAFGTLKVPLEHIFDTLRYGVKWEFGYFSEDQAGFSGIRRILDWQMTFFYVPGKERKELNPSYVGLGQMVSMISIETDLCS